MGPSSAKKIPVDPATLAFQNRIVITMRVPPRHSEASNFENLQKVERPLEEQDLDGSTENKEITPGSIKEIVRAGRKE